jgi:hypothetical protein
VWIVLESDDTYVVTIVGAGTTIVVRGATAVHDLDVPDHHLEHFNVTSTCSQVQTCTSSRVAGIGVRAVVH